MKVFLSDNTVINDAVAAVTVYVKSEGNMKMCR
jgi:hypothetical protein